MSEKVIEKHLFESVHQDVVKRTNIKSTFLFVLILIAGVFLFILDTQIGRVSSEIKLTLMLLSVALIILGLYLLVSKSSLMVFEPTGSKVLKKSVSFHINQLVKLEKMMKSGTFIAENIPTDDKGSVRLDYLISEDNKFVAMQVFQFSNYKYIADTPIFYFREDQAMQAAAFLNQYN